MKRVQRKSRSRRYESALNWPGWTDEVRFAPTEDDVRWASDAMNQGDDGHTNDDPPDEYYDQLAAESQAIDRLERGLL